MQTIFIQERDESIREILSIIIREEGFRVISALASGPETQWLIEQHQPALAILDFYLSGESCLETFRQIRNSLPRTPIIVMSCSNATALCLKYNFDASLDKPFDIGLLSSLIRNLLSRSPKKALKKPASTPISDPSTCQ